jgi:hypothetical protein
MSDDHRGYDPDAYNDGPLKRDCPLCGERDIQLPHHLPCEGTETPEGFDA